MTRNPDMPCAVCGRPMWRARTSLPEGKAICHPCRRALKPPKVSKAADLNPRPCKVCGRMFEPTRQDQRYCNAECRNKRNNWRSAEVNAKYRTKEHRDRRAALVRKIKAGEYVECTADECVMPTRQITNANGRARDGLHLGHNPDGVTYAGPQHNACNIRDGAKRGNARSRMSARAR